MNYILDEDGKPREERNILKWAEWFEKADRIVARDDINDSTVSTVFLGIDHNYHYSIVRGEPILWETMIFGGEHDGYQERFSSRNSALKGHRKACNLVRRAAND